MEDSVALRRYLERHVESDLPRLKGNQPRWRQVLVLPAYRESPALLDNLRQLPVGPGRSLVVLVLNRPERDEDHLANEDLRSAVQQHQDTGAPLLLRLNDHSDLYLLDLETLHGATPTSQGVGRARKAGCDLALEWMAQGVIDGEWICCTDADAVLPGDYFHQLGNIDGKSVTAVFPFRHVVEGADTCGSATALYELRLHHHVLGLEYAGSPYAYHSLGSCMAFRGDAYARVRGFPRRAGAEDFYLLNKLNKLAPVTRLRGKPINIRARLSSRVPFGTGPAVQAIAEAEHPEAAKIFYHPHCYEMLRALLGSLPRLAEEPGQNLVALLIQQGLSHGLAQRAQDKLRALGLEKSLQHCRRQSHSPEQFLRHFHQWFDAFLVLKFIHALRDDGWPMQPLAQLETLEPRLWPTPAQDIEGLRKGIARHWCWKQRAT
jgi:hypothetical protein